MKSKSPPSEIFCLNSGHSCGEDLNTRIRRSGMPSGYTRQVGPIPDTRAHVAHHDVVTKGYSPLWAFLKIQDYPSVSLGRVILLNKFRPTESVGGKQSLHP